MEMSLTLGYLREVSKGPYTDSKEKRFPGIPQKVGNGEAKERDQTKNNTGKEAF